MFTEAHIGGIDIDDLLFVRAPDLPMKFLWMQVHRATRERIPGIGRLSFQAAFEKMTEISGLRISSIVIEDSYQQIAKCAGLSITST